jgi:hypothetical protein
MTVRRALSYALPIALIAGTVAVLASGPLYRRWSKEECLAGYAAATNRGDTARVDLHPYELSPTQRERHHCGEVRPVQAKDVTGVLGIKP